MDEDKAGGYAMRWPRQAGMSVLLLLGLSGCAGVQPRLNWASPSAAVADRADARPSTRFAWWRHPGTEAAMLPESAPDVTVASRSGSMAGNSRPSSEAWPERRDGLLRYFPLLGRRW